MYSPHKWKREWVGDVIEGLANATVIPLQYVDVPSQHVAHLKLTQCYMSINWNNINYYYHTLIEIITEKTGFLKNVKIETYRVFVTCQRIE